MKNSPLPLNPPKPTPLRVMLTRKGVALALRRVSLLLKQTHDAFTRHIRENGRKATARGSCVVCNHYWGQIEALENVRSCLTLHKRKDD